MNEVFKGLGLYLEMMGAQVHPFMPHHLGKMLHGSVDSAGLGAGRCLLPSANQLSSDAVHTFDESSCQPSFSRFDGVAAATCDRSFSRKKDPGKPPKGSKRA